MDRSPPVSGGIADGYKETVQTSMDIARKNSGRAVKSIHGCFSGGIAQSSQQAWIVKHSDATMNEDTSLFAAVHWIALELHRLADGIESATFGEGMISNGCQD